MYSRTVPEEEVTSAFNPQLAPKQEPMDPGGSSTREADNDKKHDEYVAGFRDISKREANHVSNKIKLVTYIFI